MDEETKNRIREKFKEQGLDFDALSNDFNNDTKEELLKSSCEKDYEKWMCEKPNNRIKVHDKFGVLIKEGDFIQYDDDENTMSKWVCGETALIVFEDGKLKARMTPYNRNDMSNQNIVTIEFEDCVKVIGNLKSMKETYEKGLDKNIMSKEDIKVMDGNEK